MSRMVELFRGRSERNVRQLCAMIIAFVVAVAASCSSSEPHAAAPDEPFVSFCSTPSRGGPRAPTVDGLGPPVPPTLQPPDADRVYPTNQWWTSLLSEPTFPVWSQPLVARFETSAVAFALPPPVVSTNAIVQGFAPHILIEAGGASSGSSGPSDDVTTPADWGQFHVAVIHPVGTVTLAQGSATAWVATTAATTLRMATPGSVRVLSPTQAEITLAASSSWDVVSDSAMTLVDDTLGVPAGANVAVTVRPDDASADWIKHVATAGALPVTATGAVWHESPGGLVQSLSYSRASSAPLLLARAPHQHPARADTQTLGSVATSRGTYTFEAATSIRWYMPEPGMLLGTPQISLDGGRGPGEEADWAAEVTRAATRTSAGSYFGPKELGYRASVLDTARAFSRPETDALHTALRAEVDDWFDSRGAGDDRWLAYDPVWGGVTASSPEFGNEDYNDHHFHYGYLIQAAAAVAQHDDEAAQRWAPLMSLLAADLGVGICRAGFAPLRVFNPFEGHSYASGYARFADGNNQESSSEAVHAWWALARWAWVVGDAPLAAHARVLYATEAATARHYMLGVGAARPAGFDHTTIGILWGGKVDFATWFDPRPASIVGIQLLPFTWGSLYRAGVGATERAAEGGAASGTHWADLLAMEAALGDPSAARLLLDAVDEFESANSALLAQAWVDTLGELGTVDAAVSSSPPLGVAFERASSGTHTFVAVNPSDSAVTVTFTTGEVTIASLPVPPRSSAATSG